MVLTRVTLLFNNTRLSNLYSLEKNMRVLRRPATTRPSGAILPEPAKTPFGLMGLVCAVVPGLLIGAAISRTIANFLEENELFVPDDDDDDD